MSETSPLNKKQNFLKSVSDSQLRRSRELALDDIYEWPPPGIFSGMELEVAEVENGLTCNQFLKQFAILIEVNTQLYAREIVLRRIAQHCDRNFAVCFMFVRLKVQDAVELHFAADYDDDRRHAVGILDQMEQTGWHVKRGILLLWEGERKEFTLFGQVDNASRVILRAILRVVESMERLYRRNSGELLLQMCTLILRIWALNKSQTVVPPALRAIADVLTSISSHNHVRCDNLDIVRAARGGNEVLMCLLLLQHCLHLGEDVLKSLGCVINDDSVSMARRPHDMAILIAVATDSAAANGPVDVAPYRQRVTPFLCHSLTRNSQYCEFICRLLACQLLQHSSSIFILSLRLN